VGEVLGLAVLLVALVFGAAGLAYAVGTQRRRRELQHTPVQAIDGADHDAVLVKANQYFRSAQASVRLMESLLTDDLVRPLIPEAKRNKMQALVDEFYDL
jgi:hypothetical protein